MELKVLPSSPVQAIAIEGCALLMHCTHTCLHSSQSDNFGIMQTDPHLSRTVVVSTKLDTRLPQFARGSDVEMFLRPPGRLLEPGMLGGCPFFT